MFGVSKYKAKKVKDTPWGTFDSQGEYKRWLELVELERRGEIQRLERQVRFELIPKNDRHRKTEYVADAVYWQGGEMIVEDTKGFETPEYTLKKKLMYHVHGIAIYESRIRHRPKKAKRARKKSC